MQETWVRETWVQSLGWEDPLEKGTATHSSTFWPGEFHGLCSPWGHKESDTIEWLSLTSPLSCSKGEDKDPKILPSFRKDWYHLSHELPGSTLAQSCHITFSISPLPTRWHLQPLFDIKGSLQIVPNLLFQSRPPRYMTAFHRLMVYQKRLGSDPSKFKPWLHLLSATYFCISKND